MHSKNEFAKKPVIVTGAAGFIGSNLVRTLLADNDYTVIAFDKLTYAGNLKSLAEIWDHPNFEFVRADICDREAVASIFANRKPIGIMHLAAESHVDRSIDGPEQFVQTNIVGTFRLLQASLKYVKSTDANSGFRFLHVSTDEVFGSLGDSDPGFHEQTPYDPHSPYSASKAASDHLVRAWSDTYELPVLVTNCSNNYGPFQFPEKLIPVVILRCLRGDPIPVYGRGDNIRDWLYVGDHCTALKNVFENGRLGETYNIGGNNERTNLDLVETLCRILDSIRPRPNGKSYQDQITFVTDRPGHDQRYAIDASKMKRELGWTPKANSESGFQQTVQWYLDNENWWQDILSGDYQLDRLGLSTPEKAQ